MISSLLVLGFAPCMQAQIPNNGFEDWVSVGVYQDPVAWVTTNAVAALYGADPTCERGDAGTDGSSYMRVINRSAANGIVVHGKIVSGQGGRYGFAMVDRPVKLIGQVAYGIQPFNLGQIKVALTRWDSLAAHRVPVGSGVRNFTGTAAQWEDFSVLINYTDTATPDTAVITISAAEGVALVTAGSYLEVDEIKFSYTGMGVPGAAAPAKVGIRPTLVADRLEVLSEGPLAGLAVIDMSGRTVLRQAAAGPGQWVSVSGLAPGRYLLEARLPEGGRVRLPFIKE